MTGGARSCDHTNVAVDWVGNCRRTTPSMAEGALGLPMAPGGARYRYGGISWPRDRRGAV